MSRARDNGLSFSSSIADSVFNHNRIKGAFESFFRFNAYIAKWARKFQAHLPTSLPEKSLDIMQIKTNGVIAYTRSE